MSVQGKSSKLIRGATGDWEVVVGMEVHAQVTSNAKLFSGASTAFGGEPNAHVSLVDAAMPGMLPVINEECVRQAIRTGLGLNARINLKSVFDRKNYFYPDLPQGYQISQYKSPIVGEGVVIVDMPDGEAVSIGIERLHLEQDAGKSLHDQHPAMSYVDLNRSGVALMEIVSKPDIRSAEQAQAFLAKLRSILRYLGTCDGDMEKGNLRADVNVSVRKPGGALGTRCEIKNMNSIRFIGQAIEHEARRQVDIIEEGGTIEQETRLFDPQKVETRPMRTKEEAHDYRYFPDPDLLPLELDQAYVDALKAHLPELPDQKKARFEKYFELTPDVAERLVRERDVAEAFEDEVYKYISLVDGAPAAEWSREAFGREAQAAEIGEADTAAQHTYQSMGEGARSIATFVLGSVFAKCRDTGENPAKRIPQLNLPAFVRLIFEGVISTKIAKDVFEIMWAEGGDPRQIVEARGMKQVTDLGAIEKVVDDIIANNPDKVADAKSNPKAIGWFVGQVMKASGGKANPKAVNDLLAKKLGL